PPSRFSISTRYPRTRWYSRAGRRHREIPQATRTTTSTPMTTARVSFIPASLWLNARRPEKFSSGADGSASRPEDRPPRACYFLTGMPHFITETCIGCGVCEIKCPTHTITGDKNEKYVIHADRCIDCSVCARYCPVSCIQDQKGELVEKVK